MTRSEVSPAEAGNNFLLEPKWLRTLSISLSLSRSLSLPLSRSFSLFIPLSLSLLTVATRALDTRGRSQRNDGTNYQVPEFMVPLKVTPGLILL